MVGREKIAIDSVDNWRFDLDLGKIALDMVNQFAVGTGTAVGKGNSEAGNLKVVIGRMIAVCKKVVGGLVRVAVGLVG